MKKVYLSNGEEVELLTEYQDGKETKYVVKVAVGENCYDGECETIYENRIVFDVYENYKDIPEFLRKTELEKQVENLKKEVSELEKLKEEIAKKLKSIYHPKFKIGTPIYYTSYGKEIEELKILRIEFTETADRNFYNYYCGPYREFNEIGEYFFLTKEDAEKARVEYLERHKKDEEEKIKEKYLRAKEEYEKLINSDKQKNDK